MLAVKISDLLSLTSLQLLHYIYIIYIYICDGVSISSNWTMNAKPIIFRTFQGPLLVNMFPPDSEIWFPKTIKNLQDLPYIWPVNS